MKFDQRHRAFTLVEMMIALPLVAAFTVMAVPLLRWSVRSMADGGATVTAGARLDGTVGRMRQDVWAATTIRTPSPHELELIGPDDHAVVWHIEASALSRHSPGAADERWPNLFPDAAATVVGRTVRLRLIDGPGFRGGQLTLRMARPAATGGNR